MRIVSPAELLFDLGGGQAGDEDGLLAGLIAGDEGEGGLGAAEGSGEEFDQGGIGLVIDRGGGEADGEQPLGGRAFDLVAGGPGLDPDPYNHPLRPLLDKALIIPRHACGRRAP